jgi:hypothetical protein
MVGIGVLQGNGKYQIDSLTYKQENKFRGLSPRASYIDQSTAACRRS